MQLTAGSLTGVFGPRARHWSEQFLRDGCTHLLATDAHSTGRRLPRLTAGLALAAQWVGEAEAQRLVLDRPKAILENVPAAEVAPPPPPQTGLSPLKRWWNHVLSPKRAP